MEVAVGAVGLGRGFGVVHRIELAGMIGLRSVEVVGWVACELTVVVEICHELCYFQVNPCTEPCLCHSPSHIWPGLPSSFFSSHHFLSFVLPADDDIRQSFFARHWLKSF